MTMTLEELGNILREEREKRGLLIEDVADRLKLSVRVIRALEEGDKTSLPHAVYVRGFVTVYGTFLELDVEKLLSAEELHNDVPPSKAAFEPAMTKNRNGGRAILLFFVFCLCLAVAAFIWFQRDNDLFSNLKEDHLTTAQPAPPLAVQEKAPTQAASSPAVTASRQTQSTQQVQASPNASESLPQQTIDTQTASAHEAQNSSANTLNEDTALVAEQKNTLSQNDPIQNAEEQDTSANPSPTQTHTAPITSPLAIGAASSAQDNPTLVTAMHENAASQRGNQADAAASNDSPLASPESHKVIITAVDECWIHSNADDTDTRQFSLRKGDTFALTFDESLVLKLGNAGGVRIHYDGKEMPIPGKDGEVKTIKFPPAA